MTLFWEKMAVQARSSPQRIVFAEGEDERVIQAAETMAQQKLISPLLLGRQDVIQRHLQALGIDSALVEIMDPRQSPHAETLAKRYHELRQSKGVTFAQAQEHIRDPLVFGCLLVREGLMDGFVGGAVRTTADTVRAAFSCLGLDRGASTLFGFFLVEIPGSHPHSGMYLFADCAVTPDPSPRQLANIAAASAEAFDRYVGQTPRVALLSFSTHHSADHALVDKITKAMELIRKRDKSVGFIDGELQADAALDASVARRKGADESRGVAGRANVLIFPDLNAGNISYKLVQRLAQARCAGPVLWGLAHAASDLSRGCNVQEIIDTSLLTAQQAQWLKKN